jgi:hypothetical protein
VLVNCPSDSLCSCFAVVQGGEGGWREVFSQGSGRQAVCAEIFNRIIFKINSI